MQIHSNSRYIFNFIGFNHIPFGGIVALAWNLNNCTIMSFINVLEQIFDCTNVVADFNVDVRIVFGWQIDIMWYHPTIVQFNAMNQKCAPFIFASTNRISIYIRHRLRLELAWIFFFAFAFFHAWGIWKRSSTWTMHHASGNRLVGQPVCFWIRKFCIDHAVYIFDRVWLVVFGKEDENVCMR